MRKVSVLVVIAMLALGVLGVAPSLSYATVIITDILVTSSDGTIYHGCVGAFGSCANQIWSLPTGGITLNPSDTLVLTQNQQNLTGVSAYNFDTSDHGAGTLNVSINGGPAMVVGVPLSDPTDNGSTSQQEAADWTSPLGILGGNAEVSFGYADTLHTNACSTSRETSAVPDCLPGGGTFFPGVFDTKTAPFGATFFLGNGAGLPFAGYPTGPNCTFALNNCFDSGAILIHGTRVPEPASLLLLGGGLIGLAASGIRYRSKKA